jgi:hypothetical protein
MLRKMAKLLAVGAITLAMSTTTSCEPNNTPLPTTLTPSQTFPTTSEPSANPYLPLVASPWPGVVTFSTSDKTITSKVGERFAVGFDTFNRGGSHWAENHEGTVLTLLDSQLVVTLPAATPGATWFLFESLQQKASQVVFTYYSAANTVVSNQGFNNIIQKA